MSGFSIERQALVYYHFEQSARNDEVTIAAIIITVSWRGVCGGTRLLLVRLHCDESVSFSCPYESLFIPRFRGFISQDGLVHIYGSYYVSYTLSDEALRRTQGESWGDVGNVACMQSTCRLAKDVQE